MVTPIYIYWPNGNTYKKKFLKPPYYFLNCMHSDSFHTDLERNQQWKCRYSQLSIIHPNDGCRHWALNKILNNNLKTHWNTLFYKFNLISNFHWINNTSHFLFRLWQWRDTNFFFFFNTPNNATLCMEQLICVKDTKVKKTYSFLPHSFPAMYLSRR